MISRPEKDPFCIDGLFEIPDFVCIQKFFNLYVQPRFETLRKNNWGYYSDVRNGNAYPKFFTPSLFFEESSKRLSCFKKTKFSRSTLGVSLKLTELYIIQCHNVNQIWYYLLHGLSD